MLDTVQFREVVIPLTPVQTGEDERVSSLGTVIWIYAVLGYELTGVKVKV